VQFIAFGSILVLALIRVAAAAWVPPTALEVLAMFLRLTKFWPVFHSYSPS